MGCRDKAGENPPNIQYRKALEQQLGGHAMKVKRIFWLTIRKPEQIAANNHPKLLRYYVRGVVGERERTTDGTRYT